MCRIHAMKFVFSKKLYCYEIFLGLLTIGQGLFVAILLIKELSLSIALLLDLFVFIFYSITWLIILIQYYLLRNSLPIIIAELYDINNCLTNISYNSFFNAGIIVITILNAISRLIDLYYRQFSWDYTIASILYFISTNAPVMVAGQYSVLLYIISRQLGAITQQLSTLYNSADIRQMVDIHHALCNLAERVNNAYDIYLLHVITLSFVVIVIKIYIIIVCIVRPDVYADTLSLVITVFDVFGSGGVIILIVTSAMKAANNAERFNAELFKSIMMSSWDISKDVNNTLRTYLNMKHQLKQTACQFFYLDYRLLTSMAAGTTTYVILLVQFTLL
ncbi:gustatory receptor 68a-like isoform X1 [Halyomorpha halys]|uniref:gustatory receptor 68a-like isoform X1 n=1 Tax=Halyomorpha halys TaxID=286706 RepID=UPI0034D185D8